MESFPIFAFLIFITLISILILLQRKRKSSLIPFALPILGHLHLIIKKPLHRTLANLAKQYGPVMHLRYGFRRVLLVSSPSAIEECLTTNDITFANRPHLIMGEYFGYNYTSLLFSPYGDHWRNLRRITAQEISSYRLQFFTSVRAQEIRYLVLRLLRSSDSEMFYPVDLKTMFFELMLNTLMRIMAGKRYCGENVVNLEEARRFQEIVEESIYLIGTPNIADFLPFLRWFDLQGLEKRYAKSFQDRDAFLEYLIKERRGKGNEDTLIDSLLSKQETEPEIYTDDIIKGIVSVLLTGGSDITALTMEWGMSVLLNHPDILHEVRNEIDANVGSERLLQESDLQNLPYLHQVINETLRLYPTGPMTMHQSSEDCTVGGLHVPGGTMLQLNFWAVHRDPNVWVDPLKFDPVRFKGVEVEKELGFKYIPFGGGRRRCPGQALGMRMVGLALGSLIQCFEWKRVGEELLDMREGSGLTIPRIKPLVAMSKPRPTMKHILTQMSCLFET